MQGTSELSERVIAEARLREDAGFNRMHDLAGEAQRAATAITDSGLRLRGAELTQARTQARAANLTAARFDPEETGDAPMLAHRQTTTVRQISTEHDEDAPDSWLQ